MKAATKSTATKKTRTKKQSKRKLDDYMKAKLAAQRKLPIGKTARYLGHAVKWAKGKSGTVVKHESRGGVFVKIGDKELLCSPFAVLNAKKP